MSLTKLITQRYRTPLLFACLLCIGSAFMSPIAHAAMSKGEAASKAKSTHSGKVMSVVLISSKNGRDTYRVKLLMPDGRVKSVTVSG